MMKLLDGLYIGRYQPGDSWLHRVDALSKFLALSLLVMTCFRANSWIEIFFLTCVASALLRIASIRWCDWLHGLKPLRWLFLATILLHLFFSPGRTMLGLPWLSFDGLMVGLQTSVKLALALNFASLLSLTSSPADLAGAVSRLLRPFSRCGVDTGRIVELLSLVLALVPVLRNESKEMFDRQRQHNDVLAQGGLMARGRAVSGMLEPLVLRLADRADDMAFQIAAGEQVAEPVATEPMSATMLFCTTLVCLLLLVWVVL